MGGSPPRQAQTGLTRYGLLTNFKTLCAHLVCCTAWNKAYEFAIFSHRSTQLFSYQLRIGTYSLRRFALSPHHRTNTVRPGVRINDWNKSPKWYYHHTIIILVGWALQIRTKVICKQTNRSKNTDTGGWCGEKLSWIFWFGCGELMVLGRNL